MWGNRMQQRERLDERFLFSGVCDRDFFLVRGPLVAVCFGWSRKICEIFPCGNGLESI